MTSKIPILAALLGAALALPSQARAPEQQAGWLLLAQELPTCVLDGRKVPQGTKMCLDGYVQICGRSGRWERSGKPC